jgi:hypothetical protein
MPTSRLLDMLAETTATRDRDELDVAVARLLFDYSGALRVALYRLVDDHGRLRVARRVALCASGKEEGSEAGLPPESLTPLDARPDWAECVLLQDVVHLADGIDGSVRTIFPLHAENHVLGLLEIDTADGLRPREAGFVQAMLKVVRTTLRCSTTASATR